MSSWEALPPKPSGSSPDPRTDREVPNTSACRGLLRLLASELQRRGADHDDGLGRTAVILQQGDDPAIGIGCGMDSPRVRKPG